MRSVRLVSVLPLLVLLIVTTGSPALAQDNTVRPAKAKVSDYVVSCTGDTLNGSAVIDIDVSFSATATLHTQEGPKAPFEQTTRTAVFAVSAGEATYAFVVDASGLPATVTAYRVVLEVIDKERKKHVAVSDCAPPAVVPEVPAALLVPLSLAATSAAVLARTRRRR